MENKMTIADDIKETEARVAHLKRVLAEFPDLSEKKDRWGKKFLESKAANPKVTDVDFFHSCGCCADAAYYAAPYLTFEGTRIYSDPYKIYLGDKRYDDYNKHEWNSVWEQNMRVRSIPDHIIDKVKADRDEELAQPDAPTYGDDE